MNKQDLWEQPIKSSGEHGIFKKHDWIKEADGKLISAKLLRECAKNAQIKFNNLAKDSDGNANHPISKKAFEYLEEKNSAHKSSILLLGYAIELLLKAGIVSLLISAPKSLLENTVKCYSHKLLNIANDLQLKLSKEEQNLLKNLSSYIIQETRYPVTPTSTAEYCEKTNIITLFVADDTQFNLGVNLFNNLRRVILDIDGTRNDTKFYCRMEMDKNGYIIFRAGGSLPPVFIIKYCDTQIASELNTLSHVKVLLSRKNKEDMTIHSRLMEKTWDSATFFVVNEKKGLKRVESKK